MSPLHCPDLAACFSDTTLVSFPVPSFSSRTTSRSPFFALEVIVSGVLAGAAVGALVGTPRRYFRAAGLTLVTAIIFAAGAIVCAAAESPGILIVGRTSSDLDRLSSGTVPVYISEVAHPTRAAGSCRFFSLPSRSGFCWRTWWTSRSRAFRLALECLARRCACGDFRLRNDIFAGVAALAHEARPPR